MQQIRILYAEDYDLVLFTVKQLLELEGWFVDICRDGVAAMKKIESEEPHDLIVLDADLPGVHGLELLRRARDLEHRRHTPILMFTSVDCKDEAADAGADAYLRKPGGIRELVQTIESLLYERAHSKFAARPAYGNGR
ncbi:MAG TPA: response regulator [Pyrinomonadaceae bacterium]|nr:response regulator [Pyrinomonadaceae bacterium]